MEGIYTVDFISCHTLTATHQPMREMILGRRLDRGDLEDLSVDRFSFEKRDQISLPLLNKDTLPEET
jgi:hypothetical protein